MTMEGMSCAITDWAKNAVAAAAVERNVEVFILRMVSLIMVRRVYGVAPENRGAQVMAAQNRSPPSSNSQIRRGCD
jgi:hypothetical protein